MTAQAKLLQGIGKPRGMAGKFISRAMLYGLLIAVGLVLFTPFILALLGTFKTDAEIISWPPKILPENWLVQNWVILWETDFGGLPRPEGTTSIGLVSGLLTFFSLFLLTGMSSEAQTMRLPRTVGLAASILLAIAAGAAAALYLGQIPQTSLIRQVSVGVAVSIFALIAIGVLSMSRPDWARLLLAMVGALLAGALITYLTSQLAVLAGGGRFYRWFFNVAIFAVVRAFMMLIFCSMAAYAFARLRFPGRNLIFNFMLASMMIPGAMLLIPKYVMIAKLQWVNTAYGLIFPSVVDAFGIFLLTQFLKAIPRDLEEAAFMDGASFFQIFKDVVLPLARPALLTLFIIQFQAMWNDFLTPLLYLNTADMWVLNVALSVFQDQYEARWNITLAGAMINAMVPLTMFFFFSRYYIEGVSYTGIKG